MKSLDYEIRILYPISNTRISNGRDFMGRRMLRKMKSNQSGTIAEIRVSGDLGRRIREMGLVPGTRIKILGRAPLKDPVALRVLGFTLTLRNNEADHIIVEID